MAENTAKFTGCNAGNEEPTQELTHAEIWDDTLLIKQYDETMVKARQALASKLPTASSATDTEHSHSHRTENIGSMHPTTSHVQRKKKKKGRRKNEWQAGDHCRSHYFEDESVYEATIISINQATGLCTVRYLGYNNEEEVALSSLLRSHGDGARKKQIADSHCVNYSESEETADDSSILDSDAPMDIDKGKNGFDKSPRSTLMPPPQQQFHHGQNFSMPHLPDLPPPPALGLVDSDDSTSSEALHTMLMSWYMTGYHTGYYQGISRARKETKSHSRRNNKKSSNKYR